MAKDELNLDVAVPDYVPAVLREAADSYRDSDEELSRAWQDRHTGEIWGQIADILEIAADKIQKRVTFHFGSQTPLKGESHD